MRNLITVLILTLFTTYSFSQESEINQFSLDECIQYAYENEQMFKNSMIEIEKSEKDVGDKMSIGLPQADIGVDLRDNFVVPTQFIPASVVDPNAPEDEFFPVQFGTQYFGNAAFNVRQLIFDGSYFVGLKAAKMVVDLSSRQSIETKIELKSNVTKAFYNVLINEVGRDLVNNNFDRLDSLLRETNIMYENGFAEKIDVNRVKIEFNNATVAKKQYDDLVRLSYYLLKFQMGMPVTDSLQLQGTLSDFEVDIAQGIYSDFDYRNRIEWQVLETQENLNMTNLKYYNSMYLPKLDFYFSAGATAGSGQIGSLFNLAEDWFGFGYYGLALSVPVFDGLYKSKNIQKLKLNAIQIDNSQSYLKNSINLEVEQARVRLENAVNDFRAQQDNMDLSEEVYNVTKIKYQAGLGSNLELIEADAGFKSAQNRFYNSMFDVLSAKIDLEKALGILYQQ